MNDFQQKSNNSRKAIFFLALLYVIIFLFYVWTAAAADFKSLQFTPDPRGYHGLLADAFLHGQVSLMLKPLQALINLPMPYDPVANLPFRLHDASLYNNKYYLYFTPAIALFILAPVKALTGYYISEPLLAAVLCYIGLLFAFFTCKKLGLPPKWYSLVFIALAFNTAAPWLLRRALFYELCIAAAFASLMVAFYYFVTSLMATEKIKRKTWALGIFLSLTFLSRPNQLPTCFLLGMAFIYLSHKKEMIIPIITPIFLTLLGMMFYNFHRYGSISEFGSTYQLAGFNPQIVLPHSLHFIPLNLYSYFTTFPLINKIFPYIHPQRPTLPPEFLYKIHELYGMYMPEKIIGFPGFPIFSLILLPLFYLKRVYQQNPLVTKVLICFFLAGCVSLLVVSYAPGCTTRYLVDFFPALLLPLLLFGLMSIKTKWGRGLFVFIVLFSSLVSLDISLPEYQYLWTPKPPPTVFKKVFSAFNKGELS